MPVMDVRRPWRFMRFIQDIVSPAEVAAVEAAAEEPVQAAAEESAAQAAADAAAAEAADAAAAEAAEAAAAEAADAAAAEAADAAAAEAAEAAVAAEAAAAEATAAQEALAAAVDAAVDAAVAATEASAFDAAAAAETAELEAAAAEVAAAAAEAAAEEEGVHGRDPRLAPPWITENEQLLAELRARSTADPKPSTASRSAAVAPIVSLAQLDAALGRAEAQGRLACVKYYVPWCQSCFAIKPLYERAAEGKMADYVDFYEVDGGCARELVALADVRSFPVVQIYARGTLRTTRPMNSKVLFDEFYARLEDLVLEFADFGATVEGG